VLLKNILNSEAKKRLFSNFISLSVLQAANFIIPLIIIPYLFARLGAEKFGIIMFAQSVVVFFGLFVNYGFNLSATKEIAIHRNNIKKVSEIFSTVTIIKFSFSLIALFVFFIMILCFDKFANYRILYLLTFGSIIESILFPIWLFQGMERMKYITIIYTISKVIVAALILFLIDNSSDYLLVPILYFLGSITSGISSLFVIKKYFNINFYTPSFEQVGFQLHDGWHLFISNISINMYRNANILILGFITSASHVGYYAIAEKVIKAIQSLIGPLSESLYPFIVNKSAKQSVEKSLIDLFKISKYYFVILIVIVVLLVLFAPNVAKTLTGSNVDNIILDMRFLSVAIFFGGYNYLFGIIGLISLGHQKYFSRSVLAAGVLNVVLCFVLSPSIKDIGAAISLSISEFVLTILLTRKLITLYKK
jgi:PST family polysaccharide transporter